MASGALELKATVFLRNNGFLGLDFCFELKNIFLLLLGLNIGEIIRVDELFGISSLKGFFEFSWLFGFLEFEKFKDFSEAIGSLVLCLLGLLRVLDLICWNFLFFDFEAIFEFEVWWLW